MPRARNIKPGFMRNEDLGECEPLARLFFAGLWMWADKAGRIEDRPKRLRAEILPYDNCDGESLVSQLAARGFVIRYEVNGQRYLQVTNFSKHQNPHIHETKSTLPAPQEHQGSTVHAPEEHQSDTKPLGLDPLIPGYLKEETPSLPDGRGKSPDDQTPIDRQPVVRPTPPTDKPLSEAGKAAVDAIDRAAAEIHARHPKRRRDVSAKFVAKALTTILRSHKHAGVLQVPGQVAEINRVHAAWCATEDWQKDDGEYAKSLDNWLAPTKGRYEAAPVVSIRGGSGTPYVPPPNFMTPERMEAERDARRKRAELDETA